MALCFRRVPPPPLLHNTISHQHVATWFWTFSISPRTPGENAPATELSTCAVELSLLRNFYPIDGFVTRSSAQTVVPLAHRQMLYIQICIYIKKFIELLIVLKFLSRLTLLAL